MQHCCLPVCRWLNIVLQKDANISSDTKTRCLVYTWPPACTPVLGDPQYPLAGSVDFGRPSELADTLVVPVLTLSQHLWQLIK